MIAYHYPPIACSSGVHRTLNFSKYLPEFGWTPLVITVRANVYDQINSSQLDDIPKDIVVKRCFALDSAKHLAIRGRYLRLTALPDRWVSWIPTAVYNGLKLIHKFKPSVIWSTYPIASAHLVGYYLSRLSGLPWVADFRDSMTDDHFPAPGAKRKIFEKIEEKVIEHCTASVFTTESTCQIYRSRYSKIECGRFGVIENGYDEYAFAKAESLGPLSFLNKNEVYLVHSGTLYPSERDPTPFFNAISILRRNGALYDINLRVVLRATGHDEQFLPLVNKLQIEDVIKFQPALPYGDALREMLSADGLLLFQAKNCNHQIPAKLYEYIRAKRPIFALTDSAGDTASLLRKIGCNNISDIESPHRIASKLAEFIACIKESKWSYPPECLVQDYSRFAKTKELFTLLEAVIDSQNV